MSVPLHDFLFDQSGEIRSWTHRIPSIRGFIESRPDTVSTFSLRKVASWENGDTTYTYGSDSDPGAWTGHPPSNEIMEFCRTWRMPEWFQSATKAKYVIAGAVDASRYADPMVECRCGARFTNKYDSDINKIHDAHSHSDNCRTFDRLYARAELGELRYEYFNRLIRMGWRGNEVAPRLGLSNAGATKYAKQLGVDIQALKEEYRRRAANTYCCMLEDHGLKQADVLGIYGISNGLMWRWVNNYGDYEFNGRWEVQ